MDVGETDGESACLFKVFGGLVLGQTDYYLLIIILPGSGGHHYIGIVVFIPGSYHNAGLRGGYKCMVGAEILTPGNFFYRIG